MTLRRLGDALDYLRRQQAVDSLHDILQKAQAELLDAIATRPELADATCHECRTFVQRPAHHDLRIVE